MILLLSYLGDLFPGLRTLAQVKDAVYTVLPFTDYRPLPASRRSRYIVFEKRLGEIKRDAVVALTSTDEGREDVRTRYETSAEQSVGRSLRLACKVVGFDDDVLKRKAQLMGGAKGEAKKNFKDAAEEEYLGYMSLLASADYSVLAEKSSPHANMQFKDYPRRTHSRHRMTHRELRSNGRTNLASVP